MKTNCFFLSIFIFFLTMHIANAQEYKEKSYFDSNKKLGKDVVIKQSIIKIEDTKTYKIFEIESPDNGNYYLNAWMNGAELENFGSGKYLEYELTVNNEKQAEKIKPLKSNWHNTSLSDEKSKEKKTVTLKKGLNQIIFSCNAPEVPEIEFIRLSKDKDKSEIEEDEYNFFVADIKKQEEDRIKNPKKYNADSIQPSLKTTLPNPSGNYYHQVDATYKYTYYKLVSFNAGQQVFFATNSNNFKHVIEVFSYDKPENYSWVAVSNSSNLASININIPYTDLYFVRVRSWYQGEQGLVDLNINGQYYYNDVTASGWAGFRHAHETPTTYNYFTCNISGDTRIWIEDDSGIPGKIRAWNDDYRGGGDFSWGLASRVKKDFTMRIGAGLVSSYSSYTPSGTYDLYLKCQNSNIMSYFPNLAADDAIQSAPSSGTYNCISWSGGITDYWEWPLSYYSAYYIPGNPLGSFDNFYSSIRYPGAMTYSRSGATSSNSVVDLWALNGSYTHGSVTKPGNNHPHGYDWESKPGGLMRTFHPRNALNGSSYGSVTNYYKPTSGLKSAMLLSESIARGYSVIENIELTATEKQVVSESIDKLSFEQHANLESKYEAWKETWDNLEVAIQSDPRMYAQSKEYSDFIEYCETLGEESWPFIFDKFEQGDFFVINALEDLTLADNMEILEKVKSENSLKSATVSGAAIVRSPQSNAMKYIKELLLSTGAVTSTEDEGIIYSNSFDFSVYPNPANISSQIAFNLPYDAKVSVEVIDLTGKVLSVPQHNQQITKGNYNYQLNVPESFRGTCLVRLRINNNVNVQLLVVE